MRLRTATRCPILVATAFVLGACGSDGPDGPDFEITDSAGIRIALTRIQIWPDSTGGAISQEPILQIGLEAGDDPYLLSGVAGASRLGDGSIVVCNGADRTLRYFSADGTYLQSVGGQGQGPGELRRILRCLHRDGQTWVYQAPALPIERWDENGERGEPVAIPRPNERVAQLVDISTDGELVLRQDAPRRDLASGISILPSSLFRTDGAGAPLPLGTYDGGHWVRSDRVSFPAAFSPTLQAAALGDSTLVAWPASYDLTLVTGEGVVDRKIRRSFEAVAVTGAHRAAFELRVLEGPMPGGDVPYQSEDVRREIADMMVYPETLPAHYRVVVSIDRLIWVERGDAPRDPLPQVAEPYDAPTTWDIFHPDGEWLGPITLPAGFDPFEIGGTYVLGVHRDRLGVERIQMYHLTKPRID